MGEPVSSDADGSGQWWWADSDLKLTDEEVRLNHAGPVNNKKYIMYHGTNNKNAEAIMRKGFRPSDKGMLGHGVYLSTDPKKARFYPVGHPLSDRVILKVEVDVGKVIVITSQEHPRRTSWHDLGYDTAWVPPECGMVRSGLPENCVLDPKRINIIGTIRPQTDQQTSKPSACSLM